MREYDPHNTFVDNGQVSNLWNLDVTPDCVLDKSSVISRNPN